MKNNIAKYSYLLSLCFLCACSILYPMNAKEKIAKYLTHLVSFDTTTNNLDGNRKALAWVNEQLSPLGLHYKFHQHNGYHSLIMTTKETMKPKVWLVAHMDVVPAITSLFQPVIKEEKMYGRGVYDMKMAIACYMLLMNDLNLLDYDIGIMITGDEEIGGMDGVKALLCAGYSSNAVLLPDGGFNWNFEKEAKGVLQLKVVAHGKSTHSSTPWKGENAIDKLIVVLDDLQKHFEAKEISDYYPTMNIGIIQGGKSTNQVPDLASAEIDIRYPPTIRTEDIYTEIVEIANRKNNISIEKLKEGLPNKVDLKLECFQKWKKLAKEMYGIEIGAVSSHGSSDARFFGEKNIPTLVIAPKGGEIHSDREWIDLDDLFKFYNVMKAWVMEVSIDN